MYKLYSIVFILFLLFPAIKSFSQGCSDAGLCTVPGFNPASPFFADSIRYIRNVGIGFGLGDYSIISISPYLSSSYGLLNKFGWDFKLNASFHSGNSISTIGFGDVVYMLNYKPSHHFITSVGFKSRLNFGDKDKDGKPLPMDYQSTLGTVDILAGIGFRHPRWQVIIGYQSPLRQNSNTFQPQLWQTDSILSSFVNTNRFRRKGDILLRVSHPVFLSSKLTIIPSLLPIYHLENDRYFVDYEGYKDIEGSKGLTVNATALFEFSLKKNKKLGVTIGFPLVVRDVRPDGLTRSFVIGIDYQRLSTEKISFFRSSRKQADE